MKKNIIIVILSIIVVILICKVMAPTVVTERRINLQNRYANTGLSEKVNKEVLPESSQESEDEYYEDDDYHEEPPAEKNESFLNKKVITFEQLNKPIRFRKEPQEPPQSKFDQTESVRMTNTQRQEVSRNYNNETRQASNIENSVSNLPNSFYNNFRTCKPYREKMSAEYMGVNMDYDIEIAGWNNGKCILNFTSKMTSVGESFSQLYGIDPSDAVVSAFAPNIRCEFTQAQLLYAGDSILQEKERDKGAKNNMLKNPNEISFPDFKDISVDDAKLLQVIFGDKACKIVNIDELMKVFKSLQGELDY